MDKTYELTELESVVAEFLDHIGCGKQITAQQSVEYPALVIGLLGDLGAGKTTFTKEVAKQMGATEAVSSPTFVLRKDYTLENGRNLIHIDAYRLENKEQIFQVIKEEELKQKNNVVIIEWGDKVDKEILDKVFHFQHVSENERRICEI